MQATLSGFSIRTTLLLLIFFCLSGCYKNHLYVQQEWIDEFYLASTKIGTPDPARDDPPEGEKLLIAWDFPKSLFDQSLTLKTIVRLWDNTQKEFDLPIERTRDVTDLFFPSSNKILTYQIQVVNNKGEIIETWDHQFWTQLIQIDPE